MDMKSITLEEVVSSITMITVIIGFMISILKWYKHKILDKLDNFEVRITSLEIDSKTNKEENTILLKGQLACLKGLKEQGCNGQVTESIKEIENYLVKEAHK
jgi:hypothetical protein